MDSDKDLDQGMDLSEAIFRERWACHAMTGSQLVESVLTYMSDALGSRASRSKRFRPSALSRYATKSARVGRNPKTGEEVPINPRRVC